MINVGDTVHVTDDALKMSGGKHRKEFKVTKIGRDSFGNQWVHGDAPFEIWNATELEECTLKFKVGDKVTIKSKAEIARAYSDDVNNMPGGWNPYMDKYCGKTGEITKLPDDNGQYFVSFGDKVWAYGAEAFTLASSFTVTITFTGDTTTATDGEHTATVTKYHDDEYNEEAGAIEAIKKLYHRFPQKGDRYYKIGVSSTGVHVDDYAFDNDKVDKAYRKSGNFYETEAAAQAIADKINAIFKEEH